MAETLSPPGPDAEFSDPNIGAELKTRPKVQPAEFAARADDIFSGINYLRDKGSTESDAYAQVSSEYIYEEDNPELARFSEVILALPVVMHEQKRTEQLRAKYRIGRDRADYDRYRDSVRILVAFNHKLRDMIYENPGAFSREDLVGWLEKAAGNAGEGVVSMVNGAAAEVAVKKELDSLPEVTHSRFAGIEEDMRGTDLVATFANGTKLDIDVKHGEQATLEGHQHNHGKKTVLGVDPEDLNGFRVRRESRREVRKVLMASANMD